jgi:YD repeat-containing protein
LVSSSGWSRVTKIRAPIGSSANDYVTATTDYNGADAVTKATDPRGYSTTFLYDVDRQLTKVTDARGKTWKYYYDLAHQVTMIKDPNDRQYAYAYDATGALAAWADPLQKGVFYYYQTDANTKTADMLITRTVYNPGNNGALRSREHAVPPPQQGCAPRGGACFSKREGR